MSRRDLNYFEPLPENQAAEDRLTRASLSLMRLVPAAHGEFLRQVDQSLALTGLPEHVEFDFRTSSPHPELEALLQANDVNGDDVAAVKVISVYLTPDVVNRPIEVRESERSAIYDGVIRYGEDLVILIESKLNEGIDATQAQNVNLRGLSGHCAELRGAHVRWHELFESWMHLDERNLLAPAESVLLSDFFDSTENHDKFADLLPFTTLRRTAGNRQRRNRRLKVLLQGAAGEDVEFSNEHHWWYAWDEDWTTFSQVALWADGRDTLHLGIWPGVQQREAHALFRSPVAQHFVDLDGRQIGAATWSVKPNPGINVRVPRGANMDLTCRLNVADYVQVWQESLDRIHRYSAEDLPELFAWLVGAGLADEERDGPEFEEKYVAPRRNQVDPRAGLSVTATWSWDDAVELDEAGRLLPELRAAVDVLAGRAM